MMCMMEDRIADQREQHDKELMRMRKWLSVVVVVCLALVGVLVAILLIDMLNPNVGWICGVRIEQFVKRLVFAPVGRP